MAIDKIRGKWDAVRSQPDALLAITMLADLSEEATLLGIAERAELRIQMLTLMKIIVGNGDPSHSLITRVDNVEEALIEVKKILLQIQKLLMGDLTSGIDEESVLDRVKRADKVANAAIKLAWLVLGIVIAQIISLILNLL